MAGFDPFGTGSIVATQRRNAYGSSPLDDFLNQRQGFGYSNPELNRLVANLERQREDQALAQQIQAEQQRNLEAEAQAQAEQARNINGQESESFFDWILNSLNKPLEAVKNIAQAGGQLLTGEFGEAGKSFGRAIGSATPFSETLLGAIGLQDDVGKLLEDRSGFSTGQSGNEAFGADWRARDLASTIGALLGEKKTNTDPKGSLFSEFGQSGLQDALTVLFTGGEIIGDPTNFLFGAGAASKALKAGKTVEGALDALATVKALQATGLDDIARKAGVPLSRAPESLIGGIGGEDALKAFRGAKESALKDLRRTENLTGQFFAQADELGGVGNPLFDALDTAAAQFGHSADKLLPKGTFAEQFAAGQRDVLSGPYAFLNDILPDAAKQKYFDTLTGINKAFGGGSALFSDSTIAGRLKRLGKLREEELEDLARKGLTDGNIDQPSWKQALRAGADAFRRGFLQDSDSAAVAEILTKAPSLRRDIGYASELVFDEKLKLIDEAIKSIPTDQTQELHAKIIREVEKAGSGLSGDGFDEAIQGVASSIGEAEEMLKSFQRGNGVWIRDLEDQLNYFSRAAWSDEFLQWLQRNPAVADKLKDAQSTAARSAKGKAFAEAEAALRSKVEELAPNALPKNMPLFEGDVVKNLRKQLDDAGDRIFRARIQDELIRTNRIDFNEEAAAKFGEDLFNSLKQTSEEALVKLDTQDAVKQAELIDQRDVLVTKIDEMEGQLASLQKPALFQLDETKAEAKRLSDQIRLEELKLQKLEDKIKGIKPEKKAGKLAEINAETEALQAVIDEQDRARALIEKTLKQSKKAGEEAGGKAASGPDLAALERKATKIENRLIKAVENHIRKSGYENFKEAFDAIPQRAKALWVRQQLKKSGFEPPQSMRSGIDIFLEDGGLSAALPRDIQSLVGLGMSNVPKAVSREYKRILNLKDNAGTVLRGVDAVNKVFRGFLLSAPQSVATDVIGNSLTAMTLGGMNPADIKRGIGAYARHAGEESLAVKGAKALAKEGQPQTVKTIYGELSEADIFNELQKRGMFNQINIATQREKEVSTALDDFLQLDKKQGAVGKAFETAKKPFEAVGNEAFTFREFQDNGFRMSAAMKSLKEGGTFEDAVARAREIFFDYGDATRFEKATLRRMFMFYAFTKKTMALLGRTAFEKPIGNKLLRLMAGAGVNQGDEDFPDWAKKTLGLHLGTDEAGNPIMLGVNGNIVNTAADKLEGNAVHNLLLSLSPVAKVPLEYGLDRDLFTGKPIGFSDENINKLVRGGAADRAPSWMRYLPEGMQKVFDFREVVDEEGKTRNYEMDPRLRWVFESLMPLGQWSRVAEKATMSDERKTVGQDALSLLGVNTRSIAGGSKSEADLRHVRKARVRLEQEINGLAGRPLSITRSGELNFNEETAAGKLLIDRIQPMLDAAERQLTAANANKRQISEALQEIENREIARLFPQMGAIRDVYARLYDAEGYLEDPAKTKQAQEDRLSQLEERLAKRRSRAALSFLPD